MLRSKDLPRPLNAFPQIRTREVGALEATVAKTYGKIQFDLKQNGVRFQAIANHAQLSAIGVTYASHGADISIDLHDIAFFGQLFSMGGHATAAAGRSAESIVIPNLETFVCTAGDSVKLSYPAGFEQLVLKFEPQALYRKLELLADRPASSDLRFDTSARLAGPDATMHRVLVSRLLDWLETTQDLENTAVQELEQAVLISLLTTARHSLSHLFDTKPNDAAPWQVQRAQDFIEANWRSSLKLETIAEACETSVRSLFHTFRVSRGYTPMEFLRRVRLDRAREMLEAPRETTSVIDVALACGFANAGHFAKYYRRQFNELPSETLAVNRRRDSGAHRTAPRNR